MCNCPTCTESRDIEDMIVCKDVERLITKVKDLECRLAHEETDLAVNLAVLDGEWPNSVEILERCLERAKEKVNKNEQG